MAETGPREMAEVATPSPRVAFAQGMLIKNKGAAAACCGLVALAAFAMTYSYLCPINNYQYHRPASNAARESIQDISAETVAYYTKALAWFTGLLATISIGQGYFLYRADKLGRDNLTKVQRSFVFIKVLETRVINNKFSVTPLWENSGSTPAEEQTMWANWGTFAGLLEKRFLSVRSLSRKMGTARKRKFGYWVYWTTRYQIWTYLGYSHRIPGGSFHG
jgi:hypothetical protein